MSAFRTRADAAASAAAAAKEPLAPRPRNAFSAAARKIAIKSAAAATILGTALANASSATPGLVVQNALAFDDALSLAVIIFLGILASMMPKKMMARLIPQFGFSAMPVAFVTDKGHNHRAFAVLGHTFMRHHGPSFTPDKAFHKVVMAYRSSICGAVDIVAFGPGGEIPGATGKKLERQAILRTYAGMVYGDVPPKDAAALLSRSVKGLNLLVGSVEVEWVAFGNAASRASPIKPSAPEAPGGSKEEVEAEIAAYLEGVADFKALPKSGQDAAVKVVRKAIPFWDKIAELSVDTPMQPYYSADFLAGSGWVDGVALFLGLGGKKMYFSNIDSMLKITSLGKLVAESLPDEASVNAYGVWLKRVKTLGKGGSLQLAIMAGLVVVAAEVSAAQAEALEVSAEAEVEDPEAKVEAGSEGEEEAVPDDGADGGMGLSVGSG